MDIEDDYFSELCPVNWSPIHPNLTHSPVQFNPFSRHHHQQLSTAYDIESDKEKEDKCSVVLNGQQLSLHASQPNQPTKISTSKPIYEDSPEDFELEEGEVKRTKGIKTTYKHEDADKAGMDRPIIPVLIADTFFDKLLGHGVDGINIAALNKVEETEAQVDNLSTALNENDGGASVVSRKEQEKLSSGQRSSRLKRNFPTADRVPQRFPIYRENRRMPDTSTGAPKEIRSYSERGFVSKLRFMLPSNRTIFDIDIDKFGEKPWRNPGVDTSDFFNYGLDEKQWKDYCKLMKAQVQVGCSGQTKITASESRPSYQEGPISEGKWYRGIDECLPSTDSKDVCFYDSDVIIEIVMRDSFYENKSRKAQHMRNGRMINGDKILPFPMDSYSTQEKDSMSTNINERIGAMNTHGDTLAYRKMKQNYPSSYGREMAKIECSNEMGKLHSSGKQREHSLSHVGQGNQKRASFNLGHQTRHHKLDINLAPSLCSPRVMFTREKMENYVSEGVQKETARGIMPTNSHHSEIEMEIEGPVDINTEKDPDRLNRSSDWLKVPLAIPKNVVADNQWRM